MPSLYTFSKNSNFRRERCKGKTLLGIINKLFVFNFLPQANFPAHDMIFPWRWRWWDQIQGGYLTILKMAISEIIWLHCKRGLKSCHVYSLWALHKGNFKLQEVSYRNHVRWIIGGLYSGLVQYFWGAFRSKHLNFKVQNAKPWSRKLVFNSKIARCNLTKKNANDF